MKPSSKEAREMGCLCRQYSNSGGKGTVYQDGQLYEVFSKCPLHGEKRWYKPRKKRSLGEQAADIIMKKDRAT